MKIITLVENKKTQKNLTAKHGLSILIETNNERILFDLGPDDTFLKNAQGLNIDLKTVDKLVISHGHRDHGGGLKHFLSVNKTAKIYINKTAFNPHYAVLLKSIKLNIGLDQGLINHHQIILTDTYYKISDSLILISGIKPNSLVPSGNSSLYVKSEHGLKNDNFSHEQHLLIIEDNQKVLFSACSHTGIINIVDQIEAREKIKIDTFVGGLHLYNPINRKTTSKDYIDRLSQELIWRDVKIYTCHCTGAKAFKMLKQRLGEQIRQISTGSVIKLT